MRCFSVSQVYQNPEQSGFGAALSSLAQMSPFVRTPADAIESYAAAGYFPIIGFFIQKRVASLFFLPPFFFCPLRPPPHPAVKQSFLPPHSSRIRPFGYFPASIPDAVLHQTVVSFRLIQKKRQPRRGLPQIFRVGGITASQALFRRP